jgi:peptidoglycan-associated lipoprotein
LPQSAGAGARTAGASGTQAAGPLQDVFFDFDKDAIRDDQRGALDANVSWLKAHPAAKITLEGHADERGTNEYNLALGDRRAKTTRDYLVSKGIEAARVTTVSYGEERPFVLGHDESAWRWNRRSHFVITAQ